MSSSSTSKAASPGLPSPPASTPSRLLQNFFIFRSNIQNVLDYLGTVINAIQTKLQNYRGISKSVPMRLDALLLSLTTLLDSVELCTTEMQINEDIWHEDAHFADGRGTWNIVLLCIVRMLSEILLQLGRLPVIPASESTTAKISRKYSQQYVLPVLARIGGNMDTLNTVFPILFKLSFSLEAPYSEEDGKELLKQRYTHPFWYEMNVDMTRFRDLFDTLKMSIMNSYQKSGFISRTWAQGINSLNAIITNNKALSKRTDELGRIHANVEYVKTLWNLAETGIPEKFVSWMKPNISTRQYFKLTVENARKEEEPGFNDLASIRVLFLHSSSKPPVKIPKGWRCADPKDAPGESEAINKELVASTLKSVDEQAYQEEAMLRKSAELAQKQMMKDLETANLSGISSPSMSGTPTGTSPLPSAVSRTISSSTSASTSSSSSPSVAISSASRVLLEEIPVHQLIPNPMEPAIPDPISLNQVGTQDSSLNALTEDISDANDPALSVHWSATLKGAAKGNMDIVLHFHGGGFVSGSPSSHETYLRTWANNTKAVILSVDYSLSPDHKYPIPFLQCYYVYHWLVSKNPLNIVPRKIILSGDSAGGNLAVAVTLKAIHAGIRIPDGLVVAYPALDLTKGATTSRLTFANDVLVPWYCLEVCLDGYLPANAEPHKDFFLSPICAPDEILRQLPDDFVIMSAGYDPLLEDSVRFLRRLDKLDKNYVFEVYECPHGFWNFDALLGDASKAMFRAGNLIRSMFDPDFATKWKIAEAREEAIKQHRKSELKQRDLLQPYIQPVPKTFKWKE